MITLKPGDPGGAEIVVKGKGAALSSFEPIALPITSPAAVYLKSSEGACWAATFDGSAVRKNDGNKFIGRTP